MPTITKEEKARREESYPAMAKRYLEGEDIDLLCEEFNIPKSTVRVHFRQMGIHRDLKKKKSIAQKEIIQKATEELSLEAEKIATIAIGLGGVITRRYLPLLDKLMAEGKTLEHIAEDVMGWYEMKYTHLATEDQLKADIKRLNMELSVAYAMSIDNFTYWLRSKILERYVNNVLRARVMGVRLPVRRTIIAMQKDLLSLEGDIEKVIDVEFESLG